MPVEEMEGRHGSKVILLSHTWRVEPTPSPLSPHANIRSWAIERLAHQMPDALNYRLGPQPGEPLYVPDALNNREGPQAREPSQCLNGQSYGERLAKEGF